VSASAGSVIVATTIATDDPDGLAASVSETLSSPEAASAALGMAVADVGEVTTQVLVAPAPPRPPPHHKKDANGSGWQDWYLALIIPSVLVIVVFVAAALWIRHKNRPREKYQNVDCTEPPCEAQFHLYAAPTRFRELQQPKNAGAFRIKL